MKSSGQTGDATLIVGLVLAGGRSSRFGREKAVAELHGEPLIGRVVRVLSAGCGRIAVNAPPTSGAADFALARDLPCIADGAGEAQGPLAGIRAGLAWARSHGSVWLATAPCDTPRLPLDMVSRLYAARGHGGAVAVTSQGWEPLCALWSVEALETIAETPGHPPVHTLLHRLGAAEVAFADSEAFANLNTPQDHARATQRPG